MSLALPTLQMYSMRWFLASPFGARLFCRRIQEGREQRTEDRQEETEPRSKFARELKAEHGNFVGNGIPIGFGCLVEMPLNA